MREVLLERPILPLIVLMLAFVAGLCPESARKRHRAWAVSFVFAVCLLAVSLVLDAMLVDASNASTTLEPLLAFLAGLCFAVPVLCLPPEAGVFVTVWAQIVVELVNQMLIPFMHRIADVNTPSGVGIHFGVLALAGVLLFWAARALLFPHLTHNGSYRMNHQKTVLSLAVLFVFLFLTNYQVIFYLIDNPSANNSPIVPTFRLVVGFAALFVLYLQNAQELAFLARHELDVVRQLQGMREEQFKISQENINLINQKCHDLKHQIAALRTMRDEETVNRQISEMESAVMIYDSAIRTGNPALDVVLTEKSLYCEAHQISMTCLVDGSCVSFVDVMDLYSMFGNAIDNAIESVMKVKDPEKRVIQVAGYREKDFAFIRIRNYCEDVPVLTDGLPQTSKEKNGYHGYGLLSIRSTAEKYGGDIRIDTGENSFTLQILIPA
ncbi:MAG: GHKL domain-containing protein [Lachnospiraceae bacterium]|nr:GHKL domain-containing protein [Lachnospiraceae bacterium]